MPLRTPYAPCARGSSASITVDSAVAERSGRCPREACTDAHRPNGSHRQHGTKTGRRERYRVGVASYDKVTISVDADMVAQAREELGEPVVGLPDGAVIERAVNAYLLRRMVDATQAASDLTAEEAERIAYEELRASRRERGAA